LPCLLLSFRASCLERHRLHSLIVCLLRFLYRPEDNDSCNCSSPLTAARRHPIYTVLADDGISPAVATFDDLDKLQRAAHSGAARRFELTRTRNRQIHLASPPHPLPL
jgi:hypothetical protein